MAVNGAKVGLEDGRGECRDWIISYWLSSSSQDGFLRAGEPDYQVGSSGPAVTVPLCPWMQANTGGFHSRPRPCRRSASDECPSVPAPRAAVGASQSPLQGLCERRKVTFTLHQKSKTHTHTHTQFLFLSLWGFLIHNFNLILTLNTYSDLSPNKTYQFARNVITLLKTTVACTKTGRHIEAYSCCSLLRLCVFVTITLTPSDTLAWTSLVRCSYHKDRACMPPDKLKHNQGQHPSWRWGVRTDAGVQCGSRNGFH